MNLNQPCVVEQTDDFAVVFKPPKMHSAPLKIYDEQKTILKWYTEYLGYADNVDIMHRLDFETHGLVLIAKNQKSFEYFKALQDRGEFIKEYSAVCVPSKNGSVPGFPAPPLPGSFEPSEKNPFVLESYFRPYGPGRKLVRPVTEDKKYRETARDKRGFYRTEITGLNGNVFTVQIKRGFRHQIRCHLCWIGFPIMNDPLYPSPVSIADTKILALCAHALFFADPSTGENRECRIKSILEKSAF